MRIRGLASRFSPQNQGRDPPADINRSAVELLDYLSVWLTERVHDHLAWEGWEAIDAHESLLGEPAGRPRVKLVRRDELISAACD